VILEIPTLQVNLTDSLKRIKLKFMKKYITLIIFVALGSSLYAQSSLNIRPLSSTHPKLQALTYDIPLIEMESFNVEEYKLSVKDNRVQRFAKPFDVHIDLRSSGIPETIETGTIYRLKIKSKDALSLNLIFNTFHLDPGSLLHMYDNNKLAIIGAFSFNNNPHDSLPIFACQPISGDEITIELYEPFGNNSICILGKVNHGFISFSTGGNFGGSCTSQVDVICDEGNDWREEINSVCLLIVNGVDHCTASLVNNTEEDGRPLLLTADHCYDFGSAESNNSAAAGTIFLFNFDSPDCNGSNGNNTNTVSGAVIRSNFLTTDFLLLEANSNVPTDFYPYYAGWDRQLTPPSGGVGIHHPSADVKKISTHAQTPAMSVCVGGAPFWLINTWLTTPNGTSRPEPGSSGSPLYTSNQRLIGQLLGPGACALTSCTNSAGDPVTTSFFSSYGKLDASWTGGGTTSSRLSDWLDPVGTAPTEFFGLRYIRFYTINHDAWFTGDVVKFLNVNALPGHDIVVTELQDRFEVEGTLDLPNGVTFQVF